jgi:hypothetical protein
MIFSRQLLTLGGSCFVVANRNEYVTIHGLSRAQALL